MLDEQFLAIINNFEKLKQSKVSSVTEYVAVTKQIQSLANLLTGVLYPDFIEVTKETSFLSNYNHLISKSKLIGSKGYEYKLSESTISLFLHDKRVAKQSLMTVTELVSFLSESEDITSPEMFQLLELYLSQEVNFSLLNFSLAYIRSELPE